MSLGCRKERDDHYTLATRVLEKLPEVLSAAGPEDQTLSHLKNWTGVLLHADNLDAVHKCTPLCGTYNKVLSGGLLTTAKAGKHGAVPLLAEVFRCTSCAYGVVACVLLSPES